MYGINKYILDINGAADIKYREAGSMFLVEEKDHMVLFMIECIVLILILVVIRIIQVY